MSVVEPILEENKDRFVIFPIQHHDLWDWYKKQEASIWTAEEIDLHQDIIDWKEKLSAASRAPRRSPPRGSRARRPGRTRQTARRFRRGPARRCWSRSKSPGPPPRPSASPSANRARWSRCPRARLGHSRYRCPHCPWARP